MFTRWSFVSKFRKVMAFALNKIITHIFNFQLRPIPRARSPCPRSQPPKRHPLRRRTLLPNLSRRPKKPERRSWRVLMAPGLRKTAPLCTSEGQRPSDPPETQSTQGSPLPPGIVWTPMPSLSILWPLNQRWRRSKITIPWSLSPTWGLTNIKLSPPSKSCMTSKCAKLTPWSGKTIFENFFVKLKIVYTGVQSEMFR